MYESVQISKRIKKTARMKKIVLKDMLETCELAESTLSNTEQRAHAAEQ